MLAVAHFRRRLFKPTETFLYNYLTAFRRILPVCITFKKVNLEQFPYSYPLVELYSWHIWNRGWRWMRQGSQQEDSDLRYDLPKTAESLQQYDVRALHAHFGYTGSLDCRWSRPSMVKIFQLCRDLKSGFELTKVFSLKVTFSWWKDPI